MINFQENSNIVPSGYRILYVFLLLLNGHFSQKEINEKLSCHPSIEQAFAKDTLLKIINTLKASGIKIVKHENKYSVSSLPWAFGLDSKNLSALSDLGVFVKSLGQEELWESYKFFLSSLARYLPENISLLSFCRVSSDVTSAKYQKYLLLIKKIEQAKKNNCRIKVTLPEECCTFDTYYIEYDADSVFVCGYNVKAHENKKINIAEVKSIKQLPQVSSGMFFPSCVTFKITGRLMKSYNLRENEKLIVFGFDNLVIVNKGEDKKNLLRRLLKYKNLCEVIAPESFREEFVTMLKETLANYEML